MDSIIVQRPTILDLTNVLNAILAIISLVLIIIAIKKYNIKKIFDKWLIMYVISLITAYCNSITINYIGVMVDYEPTVLDVISRCRFLYITIIIRLIMVIYPIIKIKKSNNNLKGGENNA